MGHGAVDRHDGFAFVEVCRGGFDVVSGIRVGGVSWWVYVCVCVCFAWWFDWQWWIGMWVSCVCVFCLVGLLVAAMMEVFFFFFGMGGRFVVVEVWEVGFWWVVG